MCSFIAKSSLNRHLPWDLACRHDKDWEHGLGQDQQDEMSLTTYDVENIIARMTWTVTFHEDFDREFENLPEAVQDGLLAHAGLLKEFGPGLGRPRVDTLNGSRHRNMKELRFEAADGVWRFAFAFDPNRQAIVLVGGDKSGVSEKRFYRQLIKKADDRFDDHISRIGR